MSKVVTIIDDTLTENGGMAYVDCGEIRITVISVPRGEPVEIKSYGLGGDIENAKDYAVALATAIRIGEKWEREI